MYVNGNAHFVDQVNANNISATGMLTASSFNLQSSSGDITTGIVTATSIKVGTGLTIFQNTASGFGIGTAVARAKLDIEGHARFKTYSESTAALSISGGDVSVDLSSAQTFTLDANATINAFRLNNIPDGSSTFTIKIKSGGGLAVGINSIHVGAGATCLTKWPGGVVPVVTQVIDGIDIYSFKIFDGASLRSSPSSNTVYGIVGGQNFS